MKIHPSGWPMYLNQGKFRQNGGCGYILKPKIMRDADEKGLLYSYSSYSNIPWQKSKSQLQ